MKAPGNRLLILAIFSFVLSGCLTETTMPEQVTEYNVGCDRKDMQISDELIELNGEQSWTVECGGKKYFCTYLEESSSNCYEIHD